MASPRCPQRWPTREPVYGADRRECVAKPFAAMRKSNYRIRLDGVLNRCCALVLVLELILLNLVVKIVLQHIPRQSGHTARLGSVSVRRKSPRADMCSAA